MKPSTYYYVAYLSGVLALAGCSQKPQISTGHLTEAPSTQEQTPSAAVEADNQKPSQASVSTPSAVSTPAAGSSLSATPLPSAPSAQAATHPKPAPPESAAQYMRRLLTTLDVQLAQEIARGDLARQAMPDTSITLLFDSTAAFDPGTAELKWSYTELLTKLGQLVTRADRTQVHVIAHTDDQGGASQNLGLSERQAQAVAAVLASSGLERRRLQPEGRGEFSPVASNVTPAGRRQNRRVEISLTALPPSPQVTTSPPTTHSSSR